MRQHGHFAVEFSLACALLAAALLLRDGRGEPVALQWFEVWWNFARAAFDTLAHY
jgi:hypothetical protein